MEFSYDTKLVVKYLAFGIFSVVIIGLTAMLIPIFNFVAIIDLILGWLALGAFLRVAEIFNRTILVEREGIHFYRGRRRESLIPWDIIDDFSIAGSRFILRVESFVSCVVFKNFIFCCILIIEA